MHRLGTHAAVIFLAVLGVLLTACDSDASEGTPSDEPTSEATREILTGGPALEAPPGTNVSSGGATVEMGIGTYCWTSLCVDKIGPITKGTLTVSRGARISVAVPSGTPPLREVNIQAFPAGNSQDVGNGETAWQPDFDRATELPSSRNGQAVEFGSDLAPGKYVLIAAMYFERGDVIYSAVLEVR
ncbi:MAG TPA: hypothetical protein VG845_06440 [Dehalococcoidia bacterium]|nr:hypothetical protein [Dehalococcoidia bacterium]